MFRLSCNATIVEKDADIELESSKQDRDPSSCEICNGQMLPDGKSGCMKCNTCGFASGHCDV